MSQITYRFPGVTQESCRGHKTLHIRAEFLPPDSDDIHDNHEKLRQNFVIKAGQERKRLLFLLFFNDYVVVSFIGHTRKI